MSTAPRVAPYIAGTCFVGVLTTVAILAAKQSPTSLRLTSEVADACEACGLLYLVGGSVASSLAGGSMYS